MAEIFFLDNKSLSDLPSDSEKIHDIFEQTLSDEWCCYIDFEKDIPRILIISPEFGIIILYLTSCLLQTFNASVDTIIKLAQSHIHRLTEQIKLEPNLLNQEKKPKLYIGYGILFTDLSQEKLNSIVVGRSPFFINYDQLDSEQINLEQKFLDMVYDFGNEELDDHDIALVHKVINSTNLFP